MEYRLKKKIHLVKNCLSGFALQEVDGNGINVGSEKLPMNKYAGSVSFLAKNLRLVTSIEIDEEQENEDKNFRTIEQKIRGELHQTNYRLSMFGTDGYIEELTLSIYKLIDKNERERCSLSGNVGFVDTDDGFSWDDAFSCQITLSPERFDLLAKTIKEQKPTLVTIHLMDVSGFYFEDNFENNFPEDVKVLCFNQGQDVIFTDKCEVNPSRLERVGKFELNIVQQNKQNIELDTPIQDEDEQEENKVVEPDINALLLAEFSRNKIMLKKIHNVLMLIFAVFLMAFIKIFF